MIKLTNDQLEILVQKRNEAGLTHTVEVMNNEELAAYKINCQEAIERLSRQINNAKQGGSVQQTLIENKELLEGFIAYIDTKLSEEPKKTMKAIDKIIELFGENYLIKSKKVAELVNEEVIHYSKSNPYGYDIHHITIDKKYKVGKTEFDLTLKVTQMKSGKWWVQC